MAQQENVPVCSVVIGGRLRPSLSEGTVAGLMESFKTVGLINPITITKSGALIAGAHRLEAAKRLGWKAIPATVAPSKNEDLIRLVEVDENLIRSDLGPSERALHVQARKEIYERMHGKAKALGAHAANAAMGRDASANLADAFTTDTAARSGKSERTIQRDAQRAQDIPQLADVVGTSLDVGEELDALARLEPERQAALIAKAKSGEKISAKPEVKKVRRSEKERTLAGKTEALTAQTGQQRFNVIYADPPWRFEPYSRDTGMDRAADNHYPTMTLDRIKALNVPAADDAVLFLWATRAMLPEAIDVLQAWGFSYKTCAGWVKDRIGTGYWLRDNLELLLIGTKGNIPAPAPGTQPVSAISAAVSDHSVKPAAFHAMIEEMFPNLPKLEMFARRTRDGWQAWGNEAVEAEAA